jgi:cyclopropane-fatty-acyl-phospholipid synthase
MKAKEKIVQLLAKADIRVNGEQPWDMKVHNTDLYNRLIRYGPLGLGESYVDGWWDTDSLDQFFFRILKADLEKYTDYSPGTALLYLRSILSNLQNKNRAFHIGERHYDIGNDLYNAMLDRRMVYTCAFWENAANLDEAQEAKLELVCRKLGLKEGRKVLDIGCGWGSFAKYAAENYGAKVTGITVSKEQVELGTELCKGLPVQFRLQDYRDLDETFDHIVSLGMIEHVGYKNYREYFRIIKNSLSDKGTFVLQTIGSNYPVLNTDPWIHKYIFPNSMIPSVSQLSNAFEDRLVMEDWQNFGVDYDKTLMAWFSNFNREWSTLQKSYSERFYRMWKYYLLMSAGSFRARKNQLWQIVFTKTGLPNGYRLQKGRLHLRSKSGQLTRV